MNIYSPTAFRLCLSITRWETCWPPVIIEWRNILYDSFSISWITTESHSHAYCYMVWDYIAGWLLENNLFMLCMCHCVWVPVLCIPLSRLCIPMSTLCEQLVTLASNGLSQSTDISPEAATSAVTTLVEENTHLKEDIERVTQQLQQVWLLPHGVVCFLMLLQ